MNAALDTLTRALAAHALEVLGAFSCTPEDGFADWARSVVLVGPKEPGFWPHLQGQPEWLDGAPDPVDRWSRRVIGRLACNLGGKAYFPFGGPPYHPFYRWALRSGQVWESPVRLLVHKHQGLMVSFRGALVLRNEIDLPLSAPVCDGCDAPCLTACPVGAITGTVYDVAACHDHLDGKNSCLSGGCLVRRACPVSQSYARMPEQSAYHMRQFHT